MGPNRASQAWVMHVKYHTVTISINPATKNNYFLTPQTPQWSEHFIYEPRTRTPQMILVQKDACPALASLKEARAWMLACITVN